MATILNGFLNGNSWNKDTRKFEIKTIGTRESGAILLGLGVSGKDQEGNRVYGKPIDVKVNIKSEAEGSRVMALVNGKDVLQLDGFFVPNNWTNNEGKEIKGNQFLCYDSTTLVVKSMAPKADMGKQQQTQEVDAW